MGRCFMCCCRPMEVLDTASLSMARIISTPLHGSNTNVCLNRPQAR
ncbi:hypothetical protein ALQ64_102074 [Pseudomonas cannabina]|uniref:Uncharacterized protein n=1 Tax=Pseudomonas cannabina TaxID=86840 RepID=A0A0P9KFS1_PSECA|nr:Unknown protein sequence [Pseudomonas syringae pv. maculicola]KPW21946.1 hypothetical protein ALO83_103180 [Pseudomonas cannabina pv. alisalensis]KPW63778.1 hypothetical protein ALO81_101884 [Pseudomonas cannabina]RMN38687.1 hypothetical protein ALQ64_102074 [Pseudomonas cannabina]RMN79822.1 hypothetical protein ALQ53_102989 [Pseudomonas cannabina]